MSSPSESDVIAKLRELIAERSLMQNMAGEWVYAVEVRELLDLVAGRQAPAHADQK